MATLQQTIQAKREERDLVSLLESKSTTRTIRTKYEITHNDVKYCIADEEALYECYNKDNSIDMFDIHNQMPVTISAECKYDTLMEMVDAEHPDLVKIRADLTKYPRTKKEESRFIVSLSVMKSKTDGELQVKLKPSFYVNSDQLETFFKDVEDSQTLMKTFNKYEAYVRDMEKVVGTKVMSDIPEIKRYLAAIKMAEL